jgi:hypothetical protein
LSISGSISSKGRCKTIYRIISILSQVSIVIKKGDISSKPVPLSLKVAFGRSGAAFGSSLFTGAKSDLSDRRLVRFSHGGILSIRNGRALGRDGPTVQMGGSVGGAKSSRLKFSPRERLS